MEPSAPPSDEPVEHRLALVMNGGVSLAVWMGGVAREIDNARRASNGLPPSDDATDAERATFELWAAAIKRANVKLTVDVIAGTSAGGLNGVLLAAAIAGGVPLSARLKQMWIELGQMSAAALFKPQEKAESLMNGGVLLDGIEGAVNDLRSRTEAKSSGRDVSLIVTATALTASSRSVQDSAGRRFAEADHRRRFRFSQHGSRTVCRPSADGLELGKGQPVDHFADIDAIATAARATASFPVAFAPVHETTALRSRRVWPDWQTGAKHDWLADGGILDNSPFSAVLESIESKPVDGAWRRTVCYVDPAADGPSPGAPSHAALDQGGADLNDDQDPPPSWVAVAVSAFSLPREADFRDDIEQLNQTIRTGRSSLEVRRFRSLTEGRDAPGLLDEARGLCTRAIALYRQSCMSVAIYEVRDLLAQRSPDGYLRPAVELSKDLPVFPEPRAWLPREVPAIGATLPGTWDWGVSAAGRVLRVLLRSTSNSAADPRAAIRLRTQLSQALDKVVAIELVLDDYLANHTTVASPDDFAILSALDAAYTELGVPKLVGSIVGDAVKAYAPGDSPLSQIDVLAAALAVEVSHGAGAAPNTEVRPLFDFNRLGLSETPPLLRPAYDAAIRPPRSSCKGKVSGTPPTENNIVYGSQLHHFAAFAIADWRRWDWLWGRLNALQYLGQLLGLADDEVGELTKAIIADERPEPTAGEDPVDDLTWVKQQITTMGSLTQDAVIKQVRSGGAVPPGVDAALSLLRSRVRTAPSLPRSLTWIGQLASDALARHGQQGDVEHRAVRHGAVLFRHLFWKEVDKQR